MITKISGSMTSIVMETRIESNNVDIHNGEATIVPEPNVLYYTVMFLTNNPTRVRFSAKTEFFNITTLDNLDLYATIALRKPQAM